MGKLVVLSEGFSGLAFDVKPEKGTVGRVEDNAYVLSEPSVSSHHCEIWLKGDDIGIKDLGSTNGSFINELQLAADKEGVLRPGQILRLGQIQLRYETGKKQTDAHRQTVKIGEGGAAGAKPVFAKKNDNINKIFIAVAAVLVLVIIAALVIVFTKIGSGPAE
jgi:predicted component of type VI protein secretion system